MPPLYEHVEKTEDGERVTERVRPAEESKNLAQLEAKAADPESGWRRAEDEDAEETSPPAAPRRRRPPSAAPAEGEVPA